MSRNNISGSRGLTDASVARWAQMLFVCACALLALTLVGARSVHAASADGTAANATSQMLPTAGGVAPFAIADFDGDQRPDLARVQSGRSNSYETQYWIQLQLTQAGRQLIGIVAPLGGLRVFASDVNGDHAVDLVLSTAWLGRPVAILLNDGHGRFTAEEPSFFPEAFQQAASQRFSHTRHPRGTASATQSRPGVDTTMQARWQVPQTRPRSHSNSAVLVSSSQFLNHGRAPPSLLELA